MTVTPIREHGRDRRKRLTRKALREATLELGLERGLPDVSAEAIAERAGVSTRTFFNYFEAKEDAALLDLFVIDDRRLEELAEGPVDGVWTDLTTLFTDDAERAAEDGDELPRYMRLHAENPAVQTRQLAVFSRFQARLTDAIGARLGDGPSHRLRAAMMAGSCITAVRVGLEQWQLGGRRSSVRSHVHAAFGQLDPAFADSC